MKKRPWADIESEANSSLHRFVRRLNELGRVVPSMPPVPVRDVCALKRPNPLSVNLISDLRYDGEKLAGMLDPEERSISVEATDILGRQRFSIAHELGHCELHWLPRQVSQVAPTLFPVDKFVDKTFAPYFRCTSEDMELLQPPNAESVDHTTVIEDTRRKELEYEANKFAEFLLMPTVMVREWAKRFRGDVNKLAHQFEVSRKAMEIRLDHLGMPKKEPAQRYFFFKDLPLQTTSLEPVAGEPDSARRADQLAVVVTPQSRLRTLISEVDVADRVSDEIVLDFRLLENTDIGTIGPIQVVDMVLLNDYVLDYIVPMRTIATENLNLRVQLPEMASYASRHLSRLGLFKLLRLGNDHQLADSMPLGPDTASGSHILIRLTEIQAGVGLGELARKVSQNFLDWDRGSAYLDEFARFIEVAVLSLSHNIVQHSGVRPGLGKGYIAAQLDPIVRNDRVISYRAIIACGDVGIGIRNSVSEREDLTPISDLEALNAYLDGPTMSQIRAAIMGKWQGHMQLNSGDAMLNVGAGSKSFLTGLPRTPGFQVAILVTCRL